MSPGKFQMLDICSLRMAHEWDKLYQYNQLLNFYPNIASYLNVFIKLADPVVDYYYPECLSKFAIKVQITIGYKVSRKISVLPFYPKRAVQDDPKLKDSTELRMFKSGATIVPFKGPMMEFHSEPVRYSTRFKTSVFENVNYLNWGLDHLARENVPTQVQLGTGFTVGPTPYINPINGEEATQFVNDPDVCSVYHKTFNKDTKDCEASGFGTATEYIGVSYLWELIEYGADFKSINTPRLSYKLENEQPILDKWMENFQKSRANVSPLPILEDVEKAFGLKSLNSVWFLNGDDPKEAAASVVVGDDCNFGNMDSKISIPLYLQRDRYGFPLIDKTWQNVYDSYTKLSDTDDIDELVETAISLFGDELVIEGGKLLTGKTARGIVTKLSQNIITLLPRLNSSMVNGLLARTVATQITSGVVRTMAAVGTTFTVVGISVFVANIIDALLHFFDPAGLNLRFTHKQLRIIASRANDGLLIKYGHRNPEVTFEYLCNLFNIWSIEGRIKLAISIYILKAPNVQPIHAKTGMLFLTVVPLLLSLFTKP